jgi:hypothetical protein
MLEVKGLIRGPPGKCDICNIPIRRTLVEVEHRYGLVLPPEIIEFKITMNETIVPCCHWKRSKERGEVIAFGLDSWFIFWHIVSDQSKVISPGPACGYLGILIQMHKGMQFPKYGSPSLKLSRTQLFNLCPSTLQLREHDRMKGA